MGVSSIYFVIGVPYRNAFYRDSDDFIIVDFLFDLLYIVDMILQLFIGVTIKSIKIFEIKVIALYYLKYNIYKQK